MNLLSSSSWFVVTLSTLAAGSISALTLASQQPLATILGSGLGALGGSALTQSRKRQRGAESIPADVLETVKTQIETAWQEEKLTWNTQYQAQLTELKEQYQQQLQAICHQLSAEFQAKLELPIAPPPPAAPELASLALSELTSQSIHPTPVLGIKPLRTAILYDVENLTRGYHTRLNQIKKVSIGAILAQIQALDVVGEVILQRAYADWSHSGLTSIRSEISYLGIKPIQFVNFGHEKKTNATDIQLAVDAIDVIHQNNLIECFVIVSGDGGFTSLAGKLREYGKVIVGCSYSNAASKNLQAICHYFVHVPDPTERLISKPSAAVPPPILKSRTSTTLDPGPDTTETPIPELNERPQWPPHQEPTPIDPAIFRWSGLRETCFESLKPVESETLGEAVQKIREILNASFHLSSHAVKFQATGFNPSLIEPLIHDLIPNLKSTFEGLGLYRFNEYLRFTCTDSPYCLGRNQDGIKLCLRSSLPPGLTLEPDLVLEAEQTPW